MRRDALDDRRDEARERLTLAFAEDRIDADELERRIGALEYATDAGAIAAMVSDLPAVPMLPHADATLPAVVSRPLPVRQRLVTVLSERKRGREWTPAQTTDVFTVLGSCELDLREVPLPPTGLEIHLQAVLASVELIVPPGVRVLDDCSAVLAEVETDEVAAERDGPLITLTGYVVLSSVEVRQRFPGESSRAAKKRRKAEKKQRRALGTGR